MNKLSTQEFRELHRNDLIHVDILNIANPDAAPAPLIVGSPHKGDLIENKLLLRLTNMGNERLVLGGYRLLEKNKNESFEENEFLIQPSGIYINFSDMVNVFHLDAISVSIKGSPVHAKLEKHPDDSNMKRLASPKFFKAKAEDRDPSLPPFANPNHLGRDEYVLFIWPEKEVYLGIEETITITFENVASEFYPALRYLDVSWELKRDFLGTAYPPPDTVQGFSQVPMELKRPIGFVEPPLPIQASWLNGQNCIYSSSDKDEESNDTSLLKNELRFALSNVGLEDFTLDCSKHSRGVPYFELVMTGVKDGETGYYSSAVAEVADLVNVEIKNDSEHPDWGPGWKIQKKIQGPNVKWEIRPDLQLMPEQQQAHKRTILGTDMDATVTFTIKNLVTKLLPGVALVYFRFYNMPQHDDGQLVLFLEKRLPGEKQFLVPQLQNGGNGVASPFYWKLGQDEDAKARTEIHIGQEDFQSLTKVKVHGGLEVNDILKVENVSFRSPSLKMVGKDKKGNEKNFQIEVEADQEAKNAKLIISTQEGQSTKYPRLSIDSSGHIEIFASSTNKAGQHPPAVQIHTELTTFDNGKEGAKISIKSPNKNGKLEERMVIDSEGRVGIGKARMPEGYQLNINGKTLIDGGLEAHVKGEEEHLITGKVRQTGGDLQLFGWLNARGHATIGEHIFLKRRTNRFITKKGKNHETLEGFPENPYQDERQDGFITLEEIVLRIQLLEGFNDTRFQTDNDPLGVFGGGRQQKESIRKNIIHWEKFWKAKFRP
jgi:uncharacterized protein YrzB (UPF0473 family)